jgi:hypothetical protein
MCSTCFPRLGRPAEASLPSPGSSGASSPASTVLSKRYDFPAPVPPHFVAFAWRYLPRSLVLFAPRRTSTPPRPGVGNPVAPAGMSRRRRQDLPSSWGTPSVRLPCSVDAGRTAVTRPLQCRSVAVERPFAGASTFHIPGLHSMVFGLAVYASPGRLPRPDARLASSRWSDAPGRAFHPQVPTKGFRGVIVTSLPPFPSFAWRNHIDRSNRVAPSPTARSRSARSSPSTRERLPKR